MDLGQDPTCDKSCAAPANGHRMKWLQRQVGKAMIKTDNAREKRELKKEQGKEAQRKREERQRQQHKKEK